MKKIIKLVVVLSLLSIIILGYTFFINKDNPLPREVTDSEILADGKPMTYEYYHEIKGGYSPKTAPTYSGVVDKPNNKEEKKMDKYRCDVCGYVYNPEKGDPDNGVEPGTAFEDIPDDWVCPVCGAGKDQFSKE